MLIVTLDVLAPRMAGPAIRAWHLAEQLTRQHEVVLVSPKTVSLPPGLVDVRQVTERQLRDLMAWCNVVIFQGFVLEQYPFLANDDTMVIVDAYAPLYLEQLEQSKGLGAVAHGHVVAKGVAAINAQLLQADFVMCASERQRDLYLGKLGALGRINPQTYDEDPTLRSLIDVVPFGLPATAPVHRRQAMKGVVPGIGADDQVVLWGGGVYNWFDPLTLIRAMAAIAITRPGVKLFFLGLVHPNPDVEEMDMAGQARRLSAELGLTGTTVFFNESWVPYDRRADYLLEADAAVSTHSDHVESAFAFRTRVLDYLWAGLPMVLTEGDSLATVVAEAGAGRTVPPSDVEALAATILEVLEPKAAAECRTRAVELAQAFTWEQAVGPLARAVAFGRRAADGNRASRASPSGPIQAPGRSGTVRRDLSLARSVVRTGGLGAMLPPLRRRWQRLSR